MLELVSGTGLGAGDGSGDQALTTLPLSSGPSTTTVAALNSPSAFGIGRLFWHIREAVIVADTATGRIVLWNPGAEQLFGYPAPEALGLRLEALIPEPLQ